MALTCNQIWQIMHFPQIRAEYIYILSLIIQQDRAKLRRAKRATTSNMDNFTHIYSTMAFLNKTTFTLS